jgi:hypothetical protein
VILEGGVFRFFSAGMKSRIAIFSCPGDGRGEMHSLALCCEAVIEVDQLLEAGASHEVEYRWIFGRRWDIS